MKFLVSASLAVVLSASAGLFSANQTVFAEDKKDDKTTKVTGTIKIPKSIDSFKGHVLEIRLYAFDPRLADVGADLVEKIEIKDFSHTKGKATSRKLEIGAKGKLDSRKGYYLTIYILKDGKRTHAGDKDGKRGLCNVITKGNPRAVNIIFRTIKRRR